MENEVCEARTLTEHTAPQGGNAEVCSGAEHSKALEVIAAEAGSAATALPEEDTPSVSRW